MGVKQCMHISEAISKLKFAYYLFLSEHGITRKTQIFLYSFSVKFFYNLLNSLK